MTDPLLETWTTRELPILREALARWDVSGQPVSLEELRAQFEMTGNQMYAAIDALSNATPPYVDVTLTAGWSDWRAGGHITRVHERARRQLGTWPSADGLVTEIAVALSQAAEDAAEPEQKKRLRAAAEAPASQRKSLSLSSLATSAADAPEDRDWP